MTQHRPSAEELVQCELAVEDVPADQAEFALEVERRQHPASGDGRAEIGRETRHLIDDRIASVLALVVPAAPAGKRVTKVLAKDARDMGSRGRERVVDGARNENLDDRLRGPAALAGARMPAVHETR